MNKFIIALTFCGLLTQLTTAEDKIPRIPSPKGAKVMIVLPRDGKTVKSPVRVVFGLRGMGVCPAGLVLPDGFSPEPLVEEDQAVNHLVSVWVNAVMPQESLRIPPF